MALTLLLTALPAEVKIRRAVVERTCDIIGQKLSEEDEVSSIPRDLNQSFELVTDLPLFNTDCCHGCAMRQDSDPDLQPGEPDHAALRRPDRASPDLLRRPGRRDRR